MNNRALSAIVLCAAFGLLSWAEEAPAQVSSCPAALSTATIIQHDFSVSYCALCTVGTVRIVIENPFGAGAGVGAFENLVVSEDLRSTGLSYVPGSTVFSVENLPPGTTPPPVEPTVSGTVLTWTIDPAFVLPAQVGPPPPLGAARLILQFEVERVSNPEGLVSADRRIQASVSFEPECGAGDGFSSSTPVEELPLREPEPLITKVGRNADAGQVSFAAAGTDGGTRVYGHRHDRVVWRIRVQNNGTAPLEDVVFSDQIGPGFEFSHICPTNPDNAAVISGALPGCQGLPGGTTVLPELALAGVLGTANSVVPPGGFRDIYLVGKITSSCITDTQNRVFDIEWGCLAEPPPGGIAQTSTGFAPPDAVAWLNTNPNDPTAGLVRTVQLVGTNTAQPMGSKGTVIVRITNNTGGTVRNISLRDVLPEEYVIDPTFVPTVAMTGRSGFARPYPSGGMINTITWTNPEPGTFPLTSTDPADPLANTELTFELTSSTSQAITDPDPDASRYAHMLRHGDTLEIRFRTVLVDPQYYDKVAHPDVRTEAPGSDPPGTDPVESFAISNVLEITSYEELCTDTVRSRTPLTTQATARPEDIDVDIVGSERVLVVNSLDPTPLVVELRNNGGHDAADYFAYVSFGAAMAIVSTPAGCSATSNPPLIRGDDAPVWQLPETIPDSATVYLCDVGVIPPGATRSLAFEVIKNPDPNADDDLTFRADVIGEITLSNPDANGRQALWFPAPTQRLPEDGLWDLANNYTLDAVRARVIGFELTKNQFGTCSENNPPPDPNNDDQVQIGEECSARIRSGGWFGFLTPGFTPIAVWDIGLVDEIPAGQGYISQTAPVITSQIRNIALTPPPAPVPLSDDWFGWTFNTVEIADRITEKEHWFQVDVTTRLLNDPTELADPVVTGSPNRHAALSRNIASATFMAVFTNQLTGEEEEHDVDTTNVGYPREPRRRMDLTVTEPLLILTKEVCNESLYGIGADCSNFVDLTAEGDAFDTYVYRITVTNEASANGVTRAPAYDVVVTSDTDPSDMLWVFPLESDGVDNDGDGLIDGADAAGEGVIVPDNITQNGTPARVIASYTHSNALLRIEPGQSVVLYYRVDPDDDVAPQQVLTSTVYAEYDSLEGEFGNQSNPQRPNGDIGGAREYRSEVAQAVIQIHPVEVDPKRVLQVSNSELVGSSTAQPVSIGEEVEFQLRTLIPVAQLRNFVVRDELPEGLSCAEAPAVNLDAPPHSAAGFVPGGIFTPTCSATEVIWNFGDQTVSFPSPGMNRFDFRIQFIARVDNIAANQNGVSIINGGDATEATVSYIDENDNQVVIAIGAAELVVVEPLIELGKTITPGQVDAGDIVTVTVTATNTGAATAYNLRVLENLVDSKLTFMGEVTGADPPEVNTTDPDRPLFSWPPGFAIAPGETIEFSFALRVEVEAEPHEVLANTIEADWTSLPGQATALNSSGQIGPDGSADGMRNGALPNAGDPLNDYEAQASAEIVMRVPSLEKTDLGPALLPEIGVHKPFRVEIRLPEGTTRGVVVHDDLADGSVSYVLASNAEFEVSYEFIGIQTINGQPPGVTAFNAVPADGSSGVAVWDIGTVVTDTEDDVSTQELDPAIRIHYFARINNDLETDVGDSLRNSVVLNYINGETEVEEALVDGTDPVTVIESNLIAVKALANVTPDKQPDDPIEFDDILEYVVTISNTGNATAYDVNIVDTLPLELALYDGFTPTASIDNIAVAGFVALPAGAPDGPLVWGRENSGDGSLDVLPGSVLELTYRVVARAAVDQATALSNLVYVDWTSLQGESIYERTGAGCPNWTAPDDYCFGPAQAEGDVVPVAPPEALVKANTQPTASIGEIFRYRITVPGAPHAFDLYDVRILDDLSASAADLRFLGVARISGSGTWEPVNTGTASNLVIEDPVTGIDIPAGEQIELEITVMLENTPTNVAGLTFTNTAAYTFNRLKGNEASQRPGDPGTSPPMTIVEPELTLEKSGPAQMRIGPPGTFVLDVHNPSEAHAWGVTITDLLPKTEAGGMCDTPPGSFSARIFAADGTTAVGPALVEGTDFSSSFTGEPDCLLTINTLSAAAAIPPDHRLIITYQAWLDTNSEQDAELTNIAGATEWFSADLADPISGEQARDYTRILTDGTVGVLDHEDAHTVLVNLPVLRFEKTVANLSRGENPGTLATPGETLRYTLRVENVSEVALDDFRILDELDRMNDPPAFRAGTLTLVTLPPGADASNTSATGGAAGTGLLDIRDLSIGDSGDSLLIEFDIELAPVIANGTEVLNQARLQTGEFVIALSDDPNINGPADPAVDGDEDPTRILIESAPAFRVHKVSSYLDGDPDVLLAGERLRYTITVKNIGTDHATETVLRDEVPVHTRYVPGSTRLNGVAVPDAPEGRSPLSDGILIHAPEDPTPGVMRADASDATGNVATLIFDVIVNEDTIDGTIISNQAFVSAPAGGVFDQPSDDPRTPIPDDPTRDVVGNAPALYATKFVSLLIDDGSPGIVDPGDVLRYTITIYNFGNLPATAATLSDPVPPDTTYLADTLFLNELPVGQPDGGISPLIAGIDVSSDDLTPPLPGAGDGTLSPGGTAVIRFDVRVNDGVPSGTIIRNQAVVGTEEAPDLLTDGDGNPATGPQPTEVVVGDVQQLAITKRVAVVGGGVAEAGGTLEYLVEVRNIASVPAQDVVLTDDLDVPVAGQLEFVADSATMNGIATGIEIAGPVLTADYSAVHGPLPPGGTIRLRFRAVIGAELEVGTTITNVAVVEWNTPRDSATASVSVDVGAVPGVGTLEGAAWHDADFDRAQGSDELPLAGWIVEFYRNGQLLHSTTTREDGVYRLAGLPPNDVTGDAYELRFRAPDAGPRSATLGHGDSPFTNGPQSIADIVVASGSYLLGLNLPIEPNGVVYDAVLRTPIAGATLTLLRAGSGEPVSSQCFTDPAQQDQLSRGDGYYKFDLDFASPGCASGDFLIRVTPPDGNYIAGPSQIIPAATDASTPPFLVPPCPGGPDDAVPATPGHCEVVPSAFPPPPAVRARNINTSYHLHLGLDGSQPPGSSQIFNNHIALDPELDGVVAITKTTPSRNVSRGDLVPYVITITSTWAVDLQDLAIVDRFPPGFRYVEGSARIDGVPVEPELLGRELVWSDLELDAESTRTLVLLLAVGAGVGEGEFTNRAQVVHSLTGGALSGEATATVRVVPDPTFDCTDVIGKVFDDANRNGVQDPGERGLAGVRLVTARGLVAVTDQHGRFHITCAVVPREGRGSNFILKLDDRSLPSGYRMTTEPVMIERATRGKALRFNFGATIHRVVAIDIADALFEPGTAELHRQWRPRIELLLEELQRGPAVLRLSYLADLEDPRLVERRLKAVRSEVLQAWQALACCYELEIEQEVFWRRGAPAGQAVAPRQGRR